MDARLQRRVQRYGWDLAAGEYEALWQSQLAPAHAALLAAARLAPGERVLDVACGSGLVSLCAAAAVGVTGAVVGIDLSARMIERAELHARQRGLDQSARFLRMDAAALSLPGPAFDVALCALGLMYVAEPSRALAAIRRALRPAGRLVLAVWGERSACAWAALLPIVDAEVASEVCPCLFDFGRGDALAQHCAAAGFAGISLRRIAASFVYADAAQACRALLVGGPLALAWSRFDAGQRARVEQRYLNAIGRWRDGAGYRLPSEFVVVSATAA